MDRYDRRMTATELGQRTAPESRIHLEAVLRDFFSRTSQTLQEIVLSHSLKAVKADQKRLPTHAEALIGKLKPAWSSVAEDVKDDLEIIAAAGGEEALTALGVDDSGMLSMVNHVAGDWAERHAAKLIGQISDTTRDEIRDIVTNAFSDGSTIQELARDIRDAGAFSEQRAEMIAETESSRASTQGNVAGWKASGQVATLHFVLSADHSGPDECDDAAENSPYDIDGDLPDLPIHPNCFCSLVIGSLSGGDEED